MRRYLADGLLREREGAIYVERTVDQGTRRGLMLELDLEHYDFGSGSTSLIRPTEGTMVERLAPRIEVRSGAELELPHILVLIDDPAHTVIEPIVAARDTLPKLYETDLMLGGGRVAGYAVDRGPQRARGPGAARAGAARRRLRRATACRPTPRRCCSPSATATTRWPRPSRSGTASRARWAWTIRAAIALVEVENIHDPALEFAPIHRLLFGVSADVRQALAEAFGSRLSCTDVPSAAAMRERVQATARLASRRRADRARRALQRDRDRRPAVHAGGRHAAAVRRRLDRAGRRHARRLRARR